MENESRRIRLFRLGDDQMLRFLWRVAAAICVVVLVIAAAFGYWVIRRTEHVPEFYERARNQSSQSRLIARNEIRRDVQQARDQAARLAYWRAGFDEEQINAWLSEELPERFEKWFIRGASDPVIAIEDGQLLAAVRYRSKKFETIISCRLTVQMTEEPNLLAIALSDLKAGALPLPLEPFVRRISSEAAQGELDVRWDFTDEGPIALVNVPQDDPQYVLSPLVIESVQLVAGRLQLSGRAGDTAGHAFQPRGSVHEFVSYRQRRPGATKDRSERL